MSFWGRGKQSFCGRGTQSDIPEPQLLLNRKFSSFKLSWFLIWTCSILVNSNIKHAPLWPNYSMMCHLSHFHYPLSYTGQGNTVFLNSNFPLLNYPEFFCSLKSKHAYYWYLVRWIQHSDFSLASILNNFLGLIASMAHKCLCML